MFSVVSVILHIDSFDPMFVYIVVINFEGSTGPFLLLTHKVPCCLSSV